MAYQRTAVCDSRAEKAGSRVAPNEKLDVIRRSVSDIERTFFLLRNNFTLPAPADRRLLANPGSDRTRVIALAKGR